ncbi:MAG: hypothetical protein EPN21_16455, partial [Methylococcaceae bacterium]
ADASELARLKRNLLSQLALIGLLPVLVLVFVTLHVGTIAGGISSASRIETFARSARTHYKAFVDGVLEAVDVGSLPSNALTHLEAAEHDLQRLAAEVQDGKELVGMTNSLQGQLSALRADNSLTALLRLRTGINEANVVLDRISLRLEEQSSAQIETMVATSRTLRLVSSAFVGVMLVLWALIVRYLIRRLTMPLDSAISICKDIAEGRLSIDSRRLTRNGDIGGLIASIDVMRRKWAEVVTALRGQTQMMWQTSQNLAVQVNELENDANEQNMAAGSIAATVEQMSTSMDVIAQQANEASNHADAGGKVAVACMDAIGLVRGEVKEIATMIGLAARNVNELNAKAVGIGGIVTVIREVADQTNLLALNAAIEAARAGDAGRGFAVVADEVRKLADRTGESTQSIASMIAEMKLATQQIVVGMESSAERVQRSVDLSQDAAARMAEVQVMSESIAKVIDDVDNALQQQRQAALEIEQRIMSIVNSAEGHVATGRKVAESAALIKSVASAISADVAYFKADKATEASDFSLF